MSVHRRQFVLGPAPVSVDSSWVSVAVGDGYYLSYSRALPVASVRDRDGCVWYVLGLVVETDATKPQPAEQIATARTGEVDGLHSTWCGRWALIGGGALRADASGLLGCFYGRDRDGRPLVSSSAALLHAQLGGSPSPPLRHAVGMDWYPPPASRFSGVRSLLPSQTLVLGDRDRPVRHRPLAGGRVEQSYEETLADLEASFRTVLRNLASTGRPLWLALTGGYDSRVLLAAMLRERLDFSTFTFDNPGMSRADRVLPSLLARDADVPHRMVKRERFDEKQLQTVNEHTALHTTDRDRELHAWEHWQQLPQDAIVIGGNLFALGALYYHAKLPANPQGPAEAIEDAFGFAQHHADSPAHWDGIREWVEWIEAHPEPSIDWRDRFYWEQRGAGWASAIAQSLDLNQGDTVNPINSKSLIASVLQIDQAKRHGKRWEVDLTYRMAPFLTDQPYTLDGPFVTRLRFSASAWKHHPNKRRYATGHMRSLAIRAGISWSRAHRGNFPEVGPAVERSRRLKERGSDFL